MGFLSNLFPTRTQIDRANRNLFFKYKADRLTDLAVHSCEMGVTDEKIAEADVIVSLTSYGKRIYDVYLTIESIMQGTQKPNKIILWLAEDEFSSDKIPATLKCQIKRGLQVRFVRELKSYKKLVYSLREFPDSIVVTIDDDMIYNADLLDRLLVQHRADCSVILSNRVHLMSLNSKGELQKYEKWKHRKDVGTSRLNFLTGVGGVLYPPHCFTDEVLNESVFTNICKYADDVWFNAMAILSGTLVKKASTRDKSGNDYIQNDSVQDVSLRKINNGKNQNDVQIEAVFTKYSLYSKLKD